MAGHVILTDAYIKIGDIELGGHGTSVALSYSAEVVEVGVMGEQNIKRYGGEAKLDWSAEIECVVDEAAHGGAFFDMVGAEAVQLEIRPKSGAVSASNPAYRGPALLTAFTPLGSGAWGELVVASLSFIAAGELTRVTTPPAP